QGAAPDEEKRVRRKVLMYWAILHRAGYAADLAKLRRLMKISPEFNKEVRQTLHGANDKEWPKIDSLDALAAEFELAAAQNRTATLKSSSGKDLFDANDKALLGFLKPVFSGSTGPFILQPFRKFHDPKAGDFVEEIIKLLDGGKTVILDLGN